MLSDVQLIDLFILLTVYSSRARDSHGMKDTPSRDSYKSYRGHGAIETIRAIGGGDTDTFLRVSFDRIIYDIRLI